MPCIIELVVAIIVDDVSLNVFSSAGSKLNNLYEYTPPDLGDQHQVNAMYSFFAFLSMIFELGSRK